MQQFISVKEARERILSTISRQASTRKKFFKALNHTLADDIHSSVTIPPFDNSAVDGYAVIKEDITSPPVDLTIIEDIPAGTFPEKEVTRGACSRIMTGAPVPMGASAVVPVEWTEKPGENIVRIKRAPEPGENVRRAGEDVTSGEIVLEKGTIVTAPVVGMLASLGITEVSVTNPPVVAVVATGNELVDPSETPGPGQIRNSNGYALYSQVKSAGGEPLPPLTARDDESSIRECLEQALDADVILLSGGVSVGEYDFVKRVLDEMGMELLFWRVRQRPGKPLAYGLLHGKPVFGLPGNPVSSGICFEEYVRPALAYMLGRKEVFPELVTAVLSEPTPKKQGLHYFSRGEAFFTDKGILMVRDTGPQGSGIYSSMVRANCIIHLPEEVEDPETGTEVKIEWARWRSP